MAKVFARVLLLLIVLGWARAVSATTIFDNWADGTGNWSVPSNWSAAVPGSLPANTYNVSITETDGTSRTITYDFNGSTITLGTFTIDLTGGLASSVDTFSMAANTINVGGMEIIGESGRGTWTQSGGTATASAGILLGYNVGSSGIYNLSSSAVLTSNSFESVGNNGMGTFNQSGGTNTLVGNNSLFLGGGNGGSGTYTLSGSALLTMGGNEAIAFAPGTTGTFIQNGGTHELSGIGSNFYVGYSAAGSGLGASNGSYTLNSGFLKVGDNSISNPGAASEVIGYSGVGVFTQNGGVNQVGASANGENMYVGQNASGVGTYNLNVAPFATGLDVIGNEFVGESATGTIINNSITQYGGTFNQMAGGHLVTGNLTVGDNAGSTGAFNLGGKTDATIAVTDSLLLVQGNETVGSAGGAIGGFVQTGGVNSVGQVLYVGFGINVSSLVPSLGGYTLSGGTLSVAGVDTFGNSIYVGYNGIGIFTQTGGVSATPVQGMGNTGNLMVGFNATALGTYVMNGNTGAPALSVGSEIVGNAALGIRNAQGAITQYGGSFTQSAGMNAISQNLTIGAQTGSSGIFTLSGGQVEVAEQENAPAGAETVGLQGTGMFVQTGGTNFLFGNLDLGFRAGGQGTYLLSGGTLIVDDDLRVAANNETANTENPGGSGVLTVSGTGLLVCSSSSGAIRAFNTAGSAINLAGGTIVAYALDFNGQPGVFHWTSGTLAIVTDVSFSPTGDPTSTSAALGASVTLNNGMTLLVEGNEGLEGFSLTLNSGGTHVVNGALSLTLGSVLTQNPGSTLSYTTLTQSAGTINGTLVNTGAFSYTTGVFNGRLVNQGTVTLSGTLSVVFTAGNGIENDATLALPVGQTFVANGAGFDNLGAFLLNGGTLAGNGPAVNDFSGIMQGHGTVSAAFTNEGVLTVNGILALTGSAANVGLIEGSGTLTGALNNNGGVIDANVSGTPLTISSFLSGSSSGTENVTAGDIFNVATAWRNAGLVSVGGAGATVGGAAITNTGTIQGVGTVGAVVANSSGTIRAAGGELDMGAAGDTNSAGAQIQAGTGATIFYVQGLSTNAGAIELTGGTFDNNSRTLTNTGSIEGNGVIRTGGLTNNGVMQFASGAAQIYGAVTSTAGSGITVAGGSTATFFGAVALNNTAFQVAAGGTAVFYGAVSGNSNLTGAGVVDFEASHSPLAAGIFAPVALEVQGPATVDVPAVQVSSLFLAGNLNIAANGTASGLSVLGALTYANGKMDLANNDLVVRNTTLGAVLPLVQSGYAGGTWTGQGITASSAAANPGQGLAVVTGASYLLLNPIGLFDGVTVGAGDVLVKYTYQGDATLDGRISAADYAQIDAAFLLHTSGPTWFNGDFNYDGVVNYKDYALIDFAFMHQTGGVLAEGMIEEHAAEFGGDYLAALAAAGTGGSGGGVPEPGMLGVMGVGVAWLRGRKVKKFRG